MKEYIERAELYEAMNSQDCEFSLIDALALIEEFPAADVSPVRHGRWKNGGNGLYDTCTACGEEIYLAIPMNYCPNCGACMDKEDEHG